MIMNTLKIHLDYNAYDNEYSENSFRLFNE